MIYRLPLTLTLSPKGRGDWDPSPSRRREAIPSPRFGERGGGEGRTRNDCREF